MKFIFNFKNPSAGKKILFCTLFLFLFSWNGFGKSKALQYLDQSFTLFLNDKKVFFIFGPWGEEPLVVDRPVQDMWGAAAPFGLVLVYQKRDEIHWAVLERETGGRTVGGILQEIQPEQGIIKYAVITALDEKATAKIVFDTDYYVVYFFDKKGRKKLLREGKLEKR